MDDKLATLLTADGKPVLRFERRLAHPPEKVWRAITDPVEMTHWFPARVETELTVGAPMRFVFDSMDVKPSDGEVLEFERPRLFAYRWDDSVLRWELVPDESGCVLVFTHTLGGTGTWGDRLSAARQAAGWDSCLDLLRGLLECRTGEATDEWFARNERYVEEFGLAEGEVRETPDGYVVRFERDLVQPVEEVWTALTGRSTNEYVPPGPVTQTQPPRVLEYELLHYGAPAGRVRWELAEQEPIGGRLVLTQTLPSRLADLWATLLAAWQIHLELFVAALNGQIRDWPAERMAELTQRYASRG